MGVLSGVNLPSLPVEHLDGRQQPGFFIAADAQQDPFAFNGLLGRKPGHEKSFHQVVSRQATSPVMPFQHGLRDWLLSGGCRKIAEF